MGRDERLKGLPGGLPRGTNVPIIGQTPISVDVLDLLGRALREGDGVVLQAGTHQLYYVRAIQPAQPQPGMPPNVLEVRLRCDVRLLVVPGRPTQEITRVLAYEERIPAPKADQIVTPSEGQPAQSDGAAS